MRKLKPIAISEPTILNKLFVSNSVQQQLVDELVDRYNQYDRAAPDFNNLSAQTQDLLNSHIRTIKKFYDRTSQQVLDYKSKIRAISKLRCPYCGKPGTPGTLDHILPRESHPEFSLYSKNLVPCCYDCNSNKHTKFFDDNGVRKFLNPYYDEFISTEFVQVHIRPDSSGSYLTPLFEFQFRSSIYNMTQNQVKTCEYHFSILEISNQLRGQFASQLTILRRHFSRDLQNNTLTQDMIKDYLLQEETSHVAEHGPNCWEALFSRAVLSNNCLVQFICTTPLHLSPRIV